MTTKIHYKITPVSLGGHRFGVSLTIDEPDPGGQELQLPVWIPGSYLVRDFAQHVGTVTATQNGRAVRVEKTGKSTWQLSPVAGAVEVNYEVYAHDLSVRGAHLDFTHGFFNGSSVFLCVTGQHEQPSDVEICAPAEPVTAPWRVATTLTPAGAPEWGFGRFEAQDYEELIDHPVEMGHFDLVRFEVAGTPHFIVLSGRHHTKTSRLARDVTSICEQHIALFGEMPAMARYLFLTRVEGSGYGGLEHRASCALVCTRHALPLDDGKISEDYCRLLGLISHEYFHLWNVKRIKPAMFLPYRLQAESYTEQLWVFEGITSYYDDLALVRSGVIDEAAYLKLLSALVQKVEEGYGQRVQSLAESSFDAWIKFYKPNANSPNAVVSYYAKGALVALALDLTIRQRSSGQHSLDDVMKSMWAQYGKPLVGVPEDGFEEMTEHVTGLHLRPFFAAMIRDVKPVPLAALFADIGLTLRNKPVERAHGQLGIKLFAGTTSIGTVQRGSCSEAAGIAAADELVAIDGLKVGADNTDRLLAPFAPGETVQVHVFRRDELLTLPVVLDEPATPHDELLLNPDESDRQRRARRRWLLGKP